MALFVECSWCAHRIPSPPPDNCPKCGEAYDPEMVRVQRAVHGASEPEPEPEPEPGDTATDEDEALAEFIRLAEAGELTLSDLADEDIAAIAADIGVEAPEGAGRDELIELIQEKVSAIVTDAPEPSAQPVPRAKRKPKAAAGE